MSDPYTISRTPIVAPRRCRLIDLALLAAVAGLFVWALLL
jgi:hypothetical protein